MLSRKQRFAPKRILLPLFLAFALSGAAAQAQTPASSSSPLRRTWVRFGVGLGTYGEEAGAGILNLSHQRGGHLFSARYSTVFQVLGDSWIDLGLLYGRAFSGPVVHASLSAGPAYVYDDDEYEETAGLAVQGQAYLAIPYVPFGLSLGGIGNLNSEKFFAGVTFGVVFGDLR